MKSILKYLHSPVKINQFHVKLFSFLKFRDAITAFHFKNNVLFNKVKEWYIYFSGPNEVKHLKDILIKQQHILAIQDERREISKNITHVRNLFMEKQDKLFKLNRWDNVQNYVTLRKEEAELIKKEHELTAKFESLDKNEKELFVMLNDTVLGSYEREKTKKVYTQYWGIIFSIVIAMLCGVITKLANVEENDDKNTTQIYVGDNIKIVMDEPAIFVVIVIAAMLIITKTCM